MGEDKRLQVTETVAAPPGAVFDLLATPQRHPELDGAGMVRAVASGPERVGAVGEVFVMDMHADDLGDYQMSNEVVDFAEGTTIGWAPSIHPAGALQDKIGDIDPSGHVYRWELAADRDGTRITLTYDWNGVTDQDALAIYPRVSAEQLAASVTRAGEAAR